MAKYKVMVIKLLMKNNKMAPAGSIHDEDSFNRPVSELLKEQYIKTASKEDLEKEKAEEKKNNAVDKKSEEALLTAAK